MPFDADIAHDEWRDNSNPVMMFQKECLRKQAKASIKTNMLWMSYRSWSRENNPHGGILKKQEFYDRMDNTLGPRSLRSGVQVYAGWEFVSGDI